MNIRYIIFAAILVISGIGLFFLPETENSNEMAPEQLMSELFDQTRYVSTDEIAERIINQDPSLLLIDVRPLSATSIQIQKIINKIQVFLC